MGASPEQQRIAAANAAVNDLTDNAMKIIKGIENKTNKYGIRAGKTQGEIANYLGFTPADFYRKQGEDFGIIPSVPEQIQRGQDWLSQDIPVLGSPSHQRFEQTLAKSADEYRRQLGMGLDEIQPRFAAIHKDPAFNLQADPEAKKWSEGGLNMAQIKALTTYNV